MQNERVAEQALEIAFGRLIPAELLIVRKVCRLWEQIVLSRDVRLESFLRFWGLQNIQGESKSNDFFEKADISQFVVKHVIAKHDSVQSVSIKYRITPIKLCQLNNMTSQHSIHSRQYLYVPVTNTQDILGKVATIEYCPICCRELIVLESDGNFTDNATDKKGFNIKGLAERKLITLLGRCKRIDENVAAYYLSQSQGDLRRAMQMYEEDARYDPRTRRHHRSH
eukprot:TRINITY_DN1885_c0_g3_i1.p1 TRINITY_DN1885_c0_g3~~TRINITY_DN1885_c0_g3_i1.p1  ORF type:complete len:225 (-),score=10.47 TRINITY_DN1885_c0_g3_i1:294-968(-)